jgi:hypothetical protein
MTERSRRAPDLAVLALAGVIVAAAAALPPPAPGAAGLSIHGMTMASTCILHVLTGMDCPFCGMTRSMVALFHGRLAESSDFHPLGPALGLFLLLQIGYRIFRLLPRAPSAGWERLNPSWRMAPFYVLTAGVAAAWFVKMGMAAAGW